MIIFMSTLALMLYSLTDYTFEAYYGMRVYWLLIGVCATGICISKWSCIAIRYMEYLSWEKQMTKLFLEQEQTQ